MRNISSSLGRLCHLRDKLLPGTGKVKLDGLKYVKMAEKSPANMIPMNIDPWKIDMMESAGFKLVSLKKMHRFFFSWEMFCGIWCLKNRDPRVRNTLITTNNY